VQAHVARKVPILEKKKKKGALWGRRPVSSVRTLIFCDARNEQHKHGREILVLCGGEMRKQKVAKGKGEPPE